MNTFKKLSLVLGLAMPCSAFAAAGDLDATFGSGGKVAGGGVIAVQTDGKIVSAGTTGNNNFWVSRNYPDGALDTAFGVNGVVITDIKSVMYNIPPSGGLPDNDSHSSDAATDVAVQSDGKILVSGYSYNSNPPAGLEATDEMVVVRYLANGLVDGTFGTNGVAMSSVIRSGGLAANDRSYAMAMQSNGAIVLTGDLWQDTNIGDMVTVRFTSAGVMDTTFAGTGYKITSLSSSQDTARDVAIQADGKIVIVGDKANVGTVSFGVVRYNSNGSADTTFGPSGIRTVNFASSTTNRAYGVAIQSNAKIVVGGYSYTTATNADFALARFNANGTLDSTFDGDGKVNTNFATNSGDTGSAVKIQGDGKIVMIGTAGSTIGLTRYNTNGSLDSTFGGGGKVTNASIGWANTGLLQGDGKIVTSGGGYLARFLAQ